MVGRCPFICATERIPISFWLTKNGLTDPANKTVRIDPEGNSNSFLSIGDSYLFKLNGFTTAKNVVLAGNFNGWNNSELKMDKTSKGWQLPFVLAPGNYEYKFVVDGKWMFDPGNPFTTGSGKYENSFIALKTNHVFKLSQYLNAKSVIVTGSFNGWTTKDYRMVKENDKWIFPHLPIARQIHL